MSAAQVKHTASCTSLCCLVSLGYNRCCSSSECCINRAPQSLIATLLEAVSGHGHRCCHPCAVKLTGRAYNISVLVVSSLKPNMVSNAGAQKCTVLVCRVVLQAEDVHHGGLTKPSLLLACRRYIKSDSIRLRSPSEFQMRQSILAWEMLRSFGSRALLDRFAHGGTMSHASSMYTSYCRYVLQK